MGPRRYGRSSITLVDPETTQESLTPGGIGDGEGSVAESRSQGASSHMGKSAAAFARKAGERAEGVHLLEVVELDWRSWREGLDGCPASHLTMERAVAGRAAVRSCSLHAQEQVLLTQKGEGKEGLPQSG